MEQQASDRERYAAEWAQQQHQRALGHPLSSIDAIQRFTDAAAQILSAYSQLGQVGSVPVSMNQETINHLRRVLQRAKAHERQEAMGMQNSIPQR